MLGKLRRKFVLINMLCVGVVLLAVLASIAVMNANNINAKSRMALQHALERPNDERDMFEIKKRFGSHDGGVGPEMASVILVLLDESGNITDKRYADNIYIEEDALQDAVSQALSTSAAEGVISDYSLLYMIGTAPDGATKIALVDISSDISTIRNQILMLALAAVAGLSAFLVISVFLAKWALRPVEHAWEQQRQFVADASHELKTPLTVILANIGIMRSHRRDTVEQQERWLGNTYEEAIRMKGLVDDMLFLSKSDAAREQPVMSEVSLSDVAESTYLAFEAVAFESGINFSSRIEPDIDVQGDRAQLTRLAGILIDNAIKYAADADTVALALTRERNEAVLTVSNTGNPISDEDIGHVFERFYRADKSRAHREGGYGLGLAIAKSIVDAHCGAISVTSSPDAGTTFTVVIPA